MNEKIKNKGREGLLGCACLFFCGAVAAAAALNPQNKRQPNPSAQRRLGSAADIPFNQSKTLIDFIPFPFILGFIHCSFRLFCLIAFSFVRSSAAAAALNPPKIKINKTNSFHNSMKPHNKAIPSNAA